MKQFQFDYQNESYLQHELAKIKKACARNVGSKAVFQIHSMMTDTKELKVLTDYIDELFPEAEYFGDQAFATIIEGEKVLTKASVICTVYEYASTKTDCILVEQGNPLVDEKKPNSVISNYVGKNPWAKSLEIDATFKGAVDFLSEDAELDLPEGFCICGGITCRPDDVFSEDHYVFVKGSEPSKTGIVLFAVGGEEYYVENSYTIGWTALGKHMTITGASGTKINTIDEEPASRAYEKYLNLDFGPDFQMQAISFPLLVEKAGVECLATPVAVESDGSIVLAAKVNGNTPVRLGFGDPELILSSVRENMSGIIEFAPEVIKVYSCCGRAMYLGDAISAETRALNGIAPTSGYYTRGEFFYINKHLILFNYTMVVSACREGEKIELNFDVEKATGEVAVNKFTKYLINCIDALSKELEEK